MGVVGGCGGIVLKVLQLFFFSILSNDACIILPLFCELRCMHFIGWESNVLESCTVHYKGRNGANGRVVTVMAKCGTFSHRNYYRVNTYESFKGSVEYRLKAGLKA
jgi:hypothetical protein